MYYLYILQCSNGAYYTGITTDPKRRWQAHLAGTAAKYTRSFVPQKMLALWQIDGERALAQHIEKKVKQLPRNDKDVIVKQPQRLVEFIADDNVVLPVMPLQGCNDDASNLNPQ